MLKDEEEHGMEIRENLKKMPLGVPMTVASLGTVLTLFAGKNLHAGFGAAWAVLSLWHGWQHSKKMKNDVKKAVGMDLCSDKKKKSDSPLEAFLSTVQVDSYAEGRIRCRSLWLVGNESLKKQIEEYVRSFTGVKKAEVNTITGSILIEYRPEKLRTRPNLAALEQYCSRVAQIR